MKKIILLAFFLGMIVVRSFGQLVDEQNVTITMDLQPVLQLNMTTPDMIDFTFNQIQQYYGGEIKYAGTVLTVSSTVSWDLWAVANSQGNVALNKWDLQMPYNTGLANSASDSIPLSALELHQSPKNAYLGSAHTNGDQDYSAAFLNSLPPAGPGTNSIYEAPSAATLYTQPAAKDKYIMGDFGPENVATGGAAPGGSYLAAGVGTEYYITIDYRILPSLPATFPYATASDGTTSEAIGFGQFAAPGVYTMDVKYILAEDQ
jgi:hypothetical protein